MKSHTVFRLVPTWATLNDLERRNSTYFLLHRIRQLCKTITSQWLQNIVFHFWPQLTLQRGLSAIAELLVLLDVLVKFYSNWQAEIRPLCVFACIRYGQQPIFLCRIFCYLATCFVNITLQLNIAHVNTFLPRCVECRRRRGLYPPPRDENSVRPSVRLSVCPSVTRMNCDKTVERSVQIYIPYERTFSLVF